MEMRLILKTKPPVFRAGVGRWDKKELEKKKLGWKLVWTAPDRSQGPKDPQNQPISPGFSHQG